MFSNHDIIEHQLAIMRQIETERNAIASSPHAKTTTASACSVGHHHATEEDINLIDLNDNPDMIREQLEILASIRRQQDNRHLQTNKTTDDRKPAPTFEASGDRVTRLPNGGKKLRIKGTLHTYKAIAEGKATLVQCPCCQTVLQVVSTAKKMLCPSCKQITSMSLANQLTNANSSTSADTVIAKGLQRQEDDVALAQKRAKIALMTKR